MVLALPPSLPPFFRSHAVSRVAPSFSSLVFSLRGEGCLPCCGVRVLGELSSYRVVSGDLPGTLLFDFYLLCLEPEDQGGSRSLKGLPEPWLAIAVSVCCSVSSLENTLEGSSVWLQGAVWSSGDNWCPRAIPIQMKVPLGRIQFGGFSLKYFTELFHQ